MSIFTIPTVSTYSLPLFLFTPIIHLKHSHMVFSFTKAEFSQYCSFSLLSLEF